MGSFGKKLKKYRERHNITKLCLAKAIGTSDAYIRQIENQGYKPPTFEVCKKIASALSLSSNESLSLFESAFIERIESEKDFYNILKKTLFVKATPPTNEPIKETNYTIVWHLRKLLFHKLAPINTDVIQIIEALAEKHSISIANIVISDTNIQFQLLTNDTSSIQKNIPNLMKLTSSKIKNKFQGFSSTPKIWKNHFDIIKNDSQKRDVLSTAVHDLSLTGV